MKAKAVTLRNIPPDVTRLIRRKAEEKHTSLNKAVLSLLEERVGLGGEKRPKVLRHDLDRLAGTWTKKEAAAFEEALAAQRTIDPDVWK